MININIKEVILIHDRIIKKYRGLEGIKDYGALESSI